MEVNPVLSTIMVRRSIRKYLDKPVEHEKCKFFLDRLDIPADYKLNYIIAIGYPDEQPEAKPRDTSKVKFIKYSPYTKVRR